MAEIVSHHREFRISRTGSNSDDGDSAFVQTSKFANVYKPEQPSASGSHAAPGTMMASTSRSSPRNNNSFDSSEDMDGAPAIPKVNSYGDGSFHGVYTQSPGERVHEQSSIPSKAKEWKPTIQPYKPPLPPQDQPEAGSPRNAEVSPDRNVSAPAYASSSAVPGRGSGSPPACVKDPTTSVQTSSPKSSARAVPSADPLAKSAAVAHRPASARKLASARNLDSSILKRRTLDESLHSAYGSTEMNAGRPRDTGRRSIQFHTISIREYARCVGDNPSCSAGPPMSISWEYRQALTMPVEIYEDARPPRRDHFELVLPRKIRQDMLKVEWNISQREIAEAVRTNVRVKNQRKATVNNLGKTTIRIEEFMESFSRKLRRLLTFQKSVGKQVEDMRAKSERAAAQRRAMAQQQQSQMQQ